MKINTVVKMYASYSFGELSNDAKEYAKNDYLFNTTLRNEDLSEIWEQDIKNYWFPNSDAKIQYSLSSCQGDGVNVYGRFSIHDIRNLLEMLCLKNPFTEKEWAALAFYESELGDFVTVPENKRYDYCMADYIDFSESVIWDLEQQNGFKNVRSGLLHKFEKLCKDVLQRFCWDREKEGYAFLLEISDSDFEEMADCNCWEFDESGVLI